ncbi:MAG: N-acetyltransferase family protein [Thermoplasmata archaeon]
MPTSETRVDVRTAGESDATSIAAIYNDAVAATVATFDTEPRTLDDQRGWLREHAPPYFVLVARREGEVIGWASVSRWSERRAYAGTAEVSVYVDARHRGAGVGRTLLLRLVADGRRSGFHTLLARVADGNAVSLHLHEALGFQQIGVMREVGRKFGRLIDVHLLQLIYDDSSGPQVGFRD